MNYCIEYYKPDQIRTIRDDWKELEIGEDMTYFQSYDWNEMMVPYLLPDNILHENIYVLVRREDHSPVIIAPFWILKYSVYPYFNRRGIYFIGRSGWPDYLNMIYGTFDKEAVDFLFAHVVSKFQVDLFCPQLLKEDSALYRYLSDKEKIKHNSISNSVKLVIPATKENYMKILSKGVRQNLRTAANRLAKEGKELRLEFFDRNVDKAKCKALRESRLGKKNHIPRFRTRFNVWVMNKLSYSFPSYFPLEIDPNTQVMSAYIDNELVAFFQYGYNSREKSIVLMAVGTSTEYSRFSPGMLLMYNFILDQIEKKEVEIVDFTRGNERYKYWLGGTEYPLHHMMVRI